MKADEMQQFDECCAMRHDNEVFGRNAVVCVRAGRWQRPAAARRRAGVSSLVTMRRNSGSGAQQVCARGAGADAGR